MVENKTKHIEPETPHCTNSLAAYCYTFGSLFAGIGGFDLGFERAGMKCKWQVEINEYSNAVLEKNFPNVVRFKDVRDFPGENNNVSVDVICGGFPCQDISIAGKGAGIKKGTRSGLWYEMHRVICEIRPKFVVVENVSAILVRGLETVLSDLAESGYDAEWQVLSAAAFGAPHERERLFLVAYPSGSIGERCVFSDQKHDFPTHEEWSAAKDIKSGRGWQRWLNQACDNLDGAITKDDFCRVDDGISEGMDACGNSVVPQIAEWIGQRLMALV